MQSRVWRIVKALVSVATAAVSALLLVLFIAKPSDYGLLATAAVFLFMTVLPWINFTKPSRTLGLAGVVFSFLLLFVSSRPFEKASQYPLTCSGRRTWCEIENLLFQVGGAPLAAMPFALLGVSVLFVSVRTISRHSGTGA